jgi:hypothetical protein
VSKVLETTSALFNAIDLKTNQVVKDDTNPTTTIKLNIFRRLIN